jgi:molybdopterin-guanine dinucleotide biosynthesis protein A
MSDWPRKALAPHFGRVVTVSNDPEVSAALGIPGRKDRITGLGPLGGLLTALEWAREEGETGVFLLACDLPLVDAGFVGRILRQWRPGSLAGIPASPGPRGFEPLCGGYSVSCLPFVERRASADDRSLAGVLTDVGAQIVPEASLGSREELVRVFSNVNTPSDLRRVEEILLAGGPPQEGDHQTGRPVV